MCLTAKQIENDGILDELVKLYDNSVSAGTILGKAGVKEASFATFGTPTQKDWWRKVLQKLEFGLGGDNSLSKLLQGAADEYIGNKKLKPYRSKNTEPDSRNNVGGNLTIGIDGSHTPNEVLQILDKVQNIALTTSATVSIAVNIGYQASTHFSVTIQNFNSQEEVTQIKDKIQQELSNDGYTCNVQIEPYNFRDYYTDPLTAEGPDGQRFALDQIRASTRVKDVARGVMHNYSSDVWPTHDGQKTQAVVDMISDKGQASKRLDPTDTLHDAGVRPGDTLSISPERTAGAINPMDRDAALARVRNEVLDFADAHPGFMVEANSSVAPTEYLFKFSTEGFAPSRFKDGTPSPIDYHEVLIVLPGDFPVQAPEAWWQTDIYHPNIDPKTGFVCLGELQKQYRPALNMGILCQLLLDLAAYRNYAETEPLDIDAAKWALSDAGQKAIESIEGMSIKRRKELADMPEQKIRIRKIES
jgi:ubiquitin-protein ligase